MKWIIAYGMTQASLPLLRHPGNGPFLEKTSVEGVGGQGPRTQTAAEPLAVGQVLRPDGGEPRGALRRLPAPGRGADRRGPGGALVGGRQCGTCALPAKLRAELDRKLAAGASPAALAREHGLKPDNLRRHMDRHLLYLFKSRPRRENRRLVGAARAAYPDGHTQAGGQRGLDKT